MENGEAEDRLGGDSSSNEAYSESYALSWKRAMDRSRTLLFVITDDTRSLTTMVLAAHYVGLERDVVLCIQSLPLEDFEIGNEKVSDRKSLLIHKRYIHKDNYKINNELIFPANKTSDKGLQPRSSLPLRLGETQASPSIRRHHRGRPIHDR